MENVVARPRGREPELWYGVLAVVLCWVCLCLTFRIEMLGHTPNDSYTLIALAWRDARLSLGRENCEWLELAVYNGEYYVSFPSVPALVMLPLTFFFGENTPNTLVDGLYFLGAYVAAYCLARRYRKPGEALFMALFMTLGCNMLNLCLSGNVWYQAQLMSFFLVTCCALGMTGDRPVGWALGLFCLALSVGCRPFQATFVPFALAALYRRLAERRPGPWRRTLCAMVPYLVAPALVALALGWYNWARFRDPLEFGHNYLPEFTNDPEFPQFGLKYVSTHLRDLVRLPYFVNGRLEFTLFDGFAFWLVNPIFVTAPVAMVVKAVRRRWDALDTLLLLGIALELFLQFTHKTLGGWQFGARYLCDVVPMLLLAELRGRDRVMPWEIVAGLVAVAFNLYGTVVFRMINMGV